MIDEHEDELHLNTEVPEHRDLHAHEDDRLPWLEAVEPDADVDAQHRSRATGLLVAAVLALLTVAGGLWWMNTQTPPDKKADGKMIAAPDGDYKTKPADAGGMKVEGQGEQAVATAQGAGTDGKIDTNAKPETPIKPAPASKDMTVKPVAVTKPALAPAAAPAPAAAKAEPAAAAPAPGTGLVQLGAYGSKTSAEQQWDALKAKFSVLAPLSHTVTDAVVAGKSYYRLRAAAGDSAKDVCAKLEAAGAACKPVH